MEKPLKLITENWFFVRGLVREAAHWGDFPEKLAARFPHSAVHFLELPGNGEYFKEVSPLSIEGYAESIKQQFEAVLRAQRKANGPKISNFVVSVSLGSMVAIDWMYRCPRDLQGAVLINTSLPGVSPIYQRLQWKALPALFSSFRENDLAARERKILELTSNRPELYSAVSQQWTEIAKLRPVARANALRQLAAAARFRLSKYPPEPAILLLNSLGDRLVHPDCSRALQKRWGVPLERHPTAGHDLPLDEPDWTIQRIEAWHHKVTIDEKKASR